MYGNPFFKSTAFNFYELVKTKTNKQLRGKNEREQFYLIIQSIEAISTIDRDNKKRRGKTNISILNNIHI